MPSKKLEPITVSFFSPRRFLAEKRTHQETARGFETAEVYVPSDGFTVIPSSRASLWREGVALTSHRLQDFLSEVARGEIPRPIHSTHAISSSLNRPIKYHSLETLLNSPDIGTVSDALYLTQRLADVVATSKTGRCTSCGSSITIPHSLRELSSAVCHEWTGKEVTVALVGFSPRLSQWANFRGFSLTTTASGATSIALDSLCASAQQLQHLVEVASTVLSLEGTFLHCLGEGSSAAYGVHGACSLCERALDFASRAKIAKALRTGINARETLSPEILDRDTSGFSLRECLTASLSELSRKDTLNRFFPATLAEELLQLGLDNLSLFDTLSALDAATCVGLVILHAIHAPTNPSTLRIIELPERIFSAKHHAQISTILTHASSLGPIVVLGLESSSHNPYPLTPTHPYSDEVRYVVTCPDQGGEPIKIPLRGSLYLRAPATTGHQNWAHAVYNELLTLSSQPQQFLPSFIPLTPDKRSPSGVVASALGFSDALATLFARSQEALMLGLRPKDFHLGITARSSGLVCRRCAGSGFDIESDGQTSSAQAAPCPTCDTARFQSPVSTIRFRGMTLGDLMNCTLRDALPTLQILPKKLPTLRLVDTLLLLDLPLGLPLALLSPSERRLLALAQAILRGTASKPSIVVMEEALAGFSASQTIALHRLTSEHSELLTHAAIVLVDQSR